MTRSLEEDVLLLRAQLDQLVTSLADRETVQFRAVDWDSLDRVQAREEWERLLGFVDWLVDRYGIAETVPACWYRHTSMLEELSALHAAWLGAYLDPHALADAGVVWHDSLERVLLRLREWDRTGCAGGTHRDEVPLPGFPQQDEDRSRFVDADIDSRPEPPDDTDTDFTMSMDVDAGEDPPPLRLI